jgi:hypothetical protein
MSDTPRTDAKAVFFGFNPDEGEEFVQIDFARELERENASLRADKERLDWLQSATVRVGDVLTHFLDSEDVDLRAAIDAARKEES